MTAPAEFELRDLREAALKAPMRLLPNRIGRFYRGGQQIDELLGVPDPTDDNWSEEWLGNATAPAIDAGPDTGLARAVLLDGSSVTIRELGERFPERLYGEAHVAKYGTSPGLLLKYLDIRTHIPVHAHPTRDFARAHMDSWFGKNEAWLVLGARAIDGVPARVWVGWKRPVDKETVRGWIETQDVDAMRAALHEIKVRVGDVLFIPAGTVHSLGEGVMAMEPQEPTDFAVFAEYALYGLSEETATNGLGWELALDVFDYSILSEDELEQRIRCRPTVERETDGGRDVRLVSDEATEFFQLDELVVEGTFPSEPDGRFSIDCVRDGFGLLRGPWGAIYARRGETFVIPASVGSYKIEAAGRNPLQILRARPPR